MKTKEIDPAEPQEEGLAPLMPASLDFLDSKSVLVTGGAGSFGRRFVSTLLTETRVRRIVVFSRDELSEVRQLQLVPAHLDPDCSLLVLTVEPVCHRGHSDAVKARIATSTWLRPSTLLGHLSCPSTA